jgi:hypothetical protein
MLNLPYTIEKHHVNLTRRRPKSNEAASAIKCEQLAFVDVGDPVFIIQSLV